MAEQFDPLKPTLAPTTTLVEDRQADTLQQDVNPAPSLGEQWDLAVERGWLSEAAKRNRSTLEAREQGGFDEGFYLTQDTLKEWGQVYSQPEREYLAKSANETELEARKQIVGRMRDVYSQMNAAGTSGFMMDIAAGVLDPGLLPLTIATGGIGSVGRSTSFRVGEAALAGAAEGATAEWLLKQSNPQSTVTDVVLGAATAGFISGSIPAIGAAWTRGRQASAARQADEAAADAAQAAPARAADQRVLQRMSQRDQELLDASNALEAHIATESDVVRRSILAGDFARITPQRRIVDGSDTEFLINSLEPQVQARLSRGERKALEKTSRRVANEVNTLNARRQELLEQTPTGSGKRLRDAKLKRQQELDGITSRISALETEARQATEALAAQAPADAAARDISRLEQGIIPERLLPDLERRYAEKAKAREHGATLIKTLAKGRELKPLPDPAKVDADGVQVEQPPGDSVGAARVAGTEDLIYSYPHTTTDRMDQRLTDLSQLADLTPKSWKVYGFGPKSRLQRSLQGNYTTLNNSQSDYVRGLNAMLNVDPQGTSIDGHIPAALYQDMYNRRLIQHWEAELDGRKQYADQMGFNWTKVNMGMEPRMRDFDKQVVEAIVSGREPTGPAADAIKSAVKARQGLFQEALELRKGSGVMGFEGVESRPEYYSMILDLHNMQRTIRKHGVPKVERVLTEAYMRGRFELSEDAARTVAKAQIVRTLRRGDKAVQEMDATLSAKDRKLLVDELKARLNEASDDQSRAEMSAAIDEFWDQIAKVDELEDGVSKRAKFSLGADMTAEVDGVKMTDILDTSWNTVAQYGREAAADASIAKHGFRSRADLENTIRDVEKETIDLIESELAAARADGDTARVKQLQNYADEERPREIQSLIDTVRMLYSETLDRPANDIVKQVNAASRVGRKYTQAIRLGWNGFPSVGENANAIAEFGLTTFLRNVKAAQKIRVGKAKSDPMLEELYTIMGAYGHKENYLASTHYKEDTLGEETTSKLGNLMENTLGSVQDKTQLLSGFRTIQNGSEEIALRSMMDRMYKVANGDLKAKEKDLRLFTENGMTRQEYEDVIDYIRRNKEEVETPDGTKVRTFTAEGMDPALRDKLGAAMTRGLGRMMQRNFIGETSVFMNTEIGRVLTQFRSFPIVAMEKQLIAGMRGDKIALAQKIMWGTMLAYMSYNARVHMKAGLAEDRDEYIAKATTGPAMANGVLNMLNIAGGFSITMDGLATAQLLPEEWMAGSGRWGYRSFGVDAIPMVGAMKDVGSLYGSGANLVGSVLTGNGIDDEESERFMKNLYTTLPLLNTTAVGGTMALMNELD